MERRSLALLLLYWLFAQQLGGAGRWREQEREREGGRIRRHLGDEGSLLLQDRECLLIASSDSSASVTSAALRRAEDRQRRTTVPLNAEPCAGK